MKIKEEISRSTNHVTYVNIKNFHIYNTILYESNGLNAIFLK